MNIGVFVCGCNESISSNIDTERVAEEAETLENVSFADSHAHLCSLAGKDAFRNAIKEHELDRLVIVACSPKLHEDDFRQWASEVGMNPYCVEIVNAREQIAWVYGDRENATEAAISLMKGAVAKARLLEPLEPIRVDVKPACLVIGGGVAGIQAALDVADNGFKVYLVEREPFMGGKAAWFSKIFPLRECEETCVGDCPHCLLFPEFKEVLQNPRIHLFLRSEVINVDGYVGNFRVTIRMRPANVDSDKCVYCSECSKVCPVSVPDENNYGMQTRKAIYLPSTGVVPRSYILDDRNCGHFTGGECARNPLCVQACKFDAIDIDAKEKEVEVDVGAIVVATGFEHFDPSGKKELSCEHPRVITAPEFERLAAHTGPTGGEIVIDGVKPERVAFISCVGSREKDGNEYCSRVCCIFTAKQAHMIHEKMDGGDVVVYYADMRAYGKGFEEFFNRVRAEGVEYRRRELDDEILVTEENGGLVVKARGYEDYECDLIVLSNGAVPAASSDRLSTLLRVQRSPNGFFREQHPALSPMKATLAGIFLAGCAQGPKDIPDSVAQASGAAAQAVAFLSRDRILVEPPTANVTRSKCASCLTCVRVCPFGAIDFASGTFIDVIPALCEGCGICTAECPGKAILLPNNEDRHILASLETSVAGMEEPALVAFCCDHGAYDAADLSGMLRMSYPSRFRIIRVPCSGKVEIHHILRAIELGADAVAVVGCKDGNCHYRSGSEIARTRVNAARRLLREIGIDEDRVRMFNVSPSLADEFAEIARTMANRGTVPAPSRTVGA
ncbi:MAG: hydrogenase iron-sulfur subunit [Thermoplasmata archaeon]